MLYYKHLPSVQILCLPFLIGFLVMLSLGIGSGLSALNIKYRDFRYIVPFLLQLGLFLSPVGFSTKAIPAKWEFMYALNPLVGIIDGFRWCLTDRPFPACSLGISLFISAIFLIVGISVFRKMEREFADYI